MISVGEAEAIIQATIKVFGEEDVYFENALGRVLAEDILADRDLPPYNRVTMDGIAIKNTAFGQGIRSFFIKATQAAGDEPVAIQLENECIEIMTGAALPVAADTVIPYEHIVIADGTATLKQGVDVKPRQNIHAQAVDKKKFQVLVAANQVIDATTINIAAAVGKTWLAVKKLPRVVIVSTGDELVAVNQIPKPYQVRRSNNYAVQAALATYGLQPDLLHLPDDPTVIKEALRNSLDRYDVILLSGGVSMGRFDYVPQALDALSVAKLFHTVQQRPGKPFWFGSHAGGALVFAFPGNPVATFMCLHRYFIPWLTASLGLAQQKHYAILNGDVAFGLPLQYFLQVKLQVDEHAVLLAKPITGNGSGDFANLALANAFMELPMQNITFKKGEIHRVWPFKNIF